MLEFFVQNGLLYEAQQAVKASGRNMFPEELEMIIRACFKKGLLFVAKEAIGFLPGESEKNFYLRMLSISCLKKDLLDVAREVIELLPQGKKKTLYHAKLLINTCIKNGKLDEAAQAAKLLGRDLAQEEVEKIIMICLKNRWPSEASNAIKLLHDKEARICYYEKILTVYLEEGLFESARTVAQELNCAE